MSGWNRNPWRPLLAALLLAGAGCSRSGLPADASLLRVSQRNEPGDLDPATADLPDEFFIIRALGEGLVTPDPDGGPPRHAAATHWEISADGKQYTFHLRPDATWSNGEPVTAADFIASYKRVLHPATAAPKARLFFLVRGAEDYYHGRAADFSAVGFHAPDDHTLQISLAHPAPQFLAQVASGPWIPVNPRTVQQHGRLWTLPENHVGNGPFRLHEWTPNQHILVLKRPDYWRAQHVLVDAIRFLAFDNGDAEERAFRAGQIDVTMAVPPTKIEGYAALDPSPLRQIPLHETRFLSFNTRHAPLDDVRVRRALAMALDRGSLVTHVLGGGQTPAFHYVPDGLGGFASLESLREDHDEARRLLAAAGYPGGRDFPVLELTGWSNTPVLEAVQAMWREHLGIRVRIVVHDAKVHLAALQQGSYDIGFVTAIPDVADPADLLESFLPAAPGNYPQWTDAAYDRLLAQARASTTAGERLQRLADAEVRLTEACPVTPLYFNTKNILVQPWIHGWREDALWTRYYHDVAVDR